MIFHYCDPWESCFRHFGLMLSLNHEILRPQICCIICLWTVAFWRGLFVLPRTNGCLKLRNHGLDQWKTFAGGWSWGCISETFVLLDPCQPEAAVSLQPRPPHRWTVPSLSSCCLASVASWRWLPSIPGLCTFTVLYLCPCFCPHLLKTSFSKLFTPLFVCFI